MMHPGGPYSDHPDPKHACEVGQQEHDIQDPPVPTKNPRVFLV